MKLQDFLEPEVVQLMTLIDMTRKSIAKDELKLSDVYFWETNAREAWNIVEQCENLKEALPQMITDLMCLA